MLRARTPVRVVATEGDERGGGERAERAQAQRSWRAECGGGGGGRLVGDEPDVPARARWWARGRGRATARTYMGAMIIEKG